MIYKDKGLAIVASVLLVGCVFLLSGELNNLEIQKTGKRVEVRIVDVRQNSGNRNSSYFRFEYLGKVHIKNLIASQSDYVLNHKTIVLKTNNENSDFLFEDEDVTSEVGAIVLLMLVLAFCVFKGLRKRKKKN